MFSVYLSLSCMSKMQLDALSRLTPLVIRKNNKTILLVFPLRDKRRKIASTEAGNKQERNYDKVLIELDTRTARNDSTTRRRECSVDC
jgi:hypothetical protein